MKHRNALLLGGSFLALAVTGCQVFDAKPAADSGFNRSTAPVSTRAEFLQHTWVDSAYRGKPVKDHFSSVYIAPVNTSHMA